MSNAPRQSLETCTHDRRPGTTVCLRCRHDAHVQASGNRRRLMLRGGALAIVAATVVLAATIGAPAIRAKGEAWRHGSGKAVPAVPVGQVGAPAVVVDSSAAVRPEAAAAAAPQSVTVAGGAPLTPILAEGESALIDSVTAFRADSVVTLSFDAATVRTRNGEKFEQFVRSTLPAIYGHAVDSVLAKMPTGAISRQGNIIGDLATRGVHIPLDSVWQIQLFPETRSGVGGPIVIRYRVAVVGVTE